MSDALRGVGFVAALVIVIGTFGTAAALRVHFRRAVSTWPNAYRCTFRQEQAS